MTGKLVRHSHHRNKYSIFSYMKLIKTLYMTPSLIGVLFLGVPNQRYSYPSWLLSCLRPSCINRSLSASSIPSEELQQCFALTILPNPFKRSIFRPSGNIHQNRTLSCLKDSFDPPDYFIHSPLVPALTVKSGEFSSGYPFVLWKWIIIGTCRDKWKQLLYKMHSFIAFWTVHSITLFKVIVKNTYYHW